MRGPCQRQTVFYTPETITISEGQKIRGNLSCRPNTKNNRDLDITIGYETEGGKRTTVEYKMCVVFPSFGAAPTRLVNSADRWSGVDCIFMFILSCFVVLACRKSHVALVRLLSGDLWWFRAVDIQVLINSHTCTSLEYHVVDAVRRNVTVSVPVVSAGAVTQSGLGRVSGFALARYLTSAPSVSTSAIHQAVPRGCGSGEARLWTDCAFLRRTYKPATCTLPMIFSSNGNKQTFDRMGGQVSLHYGTR